MSDGQKPKLVAVLSAQRAYEDILVDAVIKWWEKHQYDIGEQADADGYNEVYNLYDEEPEFVKIAKRLKGGV